MLNVFCDFFFLIHLGLVEFVSQSEAGFWPCEPIRAPTNNNTLTEVVHVVQKAPEIVIRLKANLKCKLRKKKMCIFKWQKVEVITF